MFMAQISQVPLFSAAFLAKLDDIELRALNAGLNLTAMCKSMHISRSTPDRWRRRIPRTIAIIDQMEKCVLEAERKKRAAFATDKKHDSAVA